MATVSFPARGMPRVPRRRGARGRQCNAEPARPSRRNSPGSFTTETQRHREPKRSSRRIRSRFQRAKRATRVLWFSVPLRLCGGILFWSLCLRGDLLGRGPGPRPASKMAPPRGRGRTGRLRGATPPGNATGLLAGPAKPNTVPGAIPVTEKSMAPRLKSKLGPLLSVCNRFVRFSFVHVRLESVRRFR